ncbi:glycosyltransferase family 4 protein [Candidatus Sumerlaeota bacterium]|nr:glycosyltransferase family 4 protein [Candidatus Sumerlaeota bacterium]
MRILYICSEYPPDRAGGIGVFTRQLACAMALRGHDVFVLGVSGSPRTVDDDGVRVTMISDRNFAGPHATYLARQWRLSRAARTIIVEHGIQIVEAPDYRGQAAFLNLPTPPRIPIVVRYHGTASVLARARRNRVSRLTAFLEQRGLAAATHRVAVSQFIADTTQRVHRGTPAVDEVLHNFTDSRIFFPTPATARDPNLLLFVGKIALVKGVKELFAALPRILLRFPALRLEMAAGDSTDGAGRTSLKEELLRELPTEFHPRVIFHGAVPHAGLPDLYRRAGACVFPSRMEAMALAPLEAMACGAAVVVSANSSMREEVDHGVTGLHADSADPEDLAAKVAMLVEDRGLAERLGTAAHRAVLEKFDLPVALSRNEQFYRGCIGT